MAMIDDALQDSDNVRILIYGDAKMRKTTFALRAAELGFNVILCDIDYGFHVAKTLTPEARRRIFHVDMRAPVEGYQNCGAMTLAHAMNGGTVVYNEQSRTYTRTTAVEADQSYVVFELSKLTSRDVLVIDSWTQLFQHITLADRRVSDPLQVPKLEWDDYAKLRLALDHFISNMQRLNCHVIVVGHGEDWAKRKADAPAKAKAEDAIKEIRTQPMSVSRAHAMTLAKNFTDVLFFEAPNAMTGVQINTKGTDTFNAGSRSIPPGVKPFDKVSFADFVPQSMLDLVKSNEKYSALGVRTMQGADLLAAREAAKANSQIPVDGKKPSLIKQIKR